MYLHFPLNSSFFICCGHCPSFQAAEDKKLFDAASRRQEDVVRTCIANGADVDGHKDEVRETPRTLLLFYQFPTVAPAHYQRKSLISRAHYFTFLHCICPDDELYFF